MSALAVGKAVKVIGVVEPEKHLGPAEYVGQVGEVSGFTADGTMWVVRFGDGGQFGFYAEELEVVES